jgi:hypothetical protein
MPWETPATGIGPDNVPIPDLANYTGLSEARRLISATLANKSIALRV